MKKNLWDQFSIIHEDEEFLVVDKPPHVLVHPTKPDGTLTLRDALFSLLGYELVTGGQVSIVNRLDRETSGIVVIAKTAAAARRAGIAMQRREVSKIYYALVFGWPKCDEWECCEPIIRRGEIGESPVYLERMVHPSGAPSHTTFRVVERIEIERGKFSLVEARPLTGRTHQIRVHLAASNYPVMGDKLYARGSQMYLDFVKYGWTPEHETALWLDRHALHCSQMALLGFRWHTDIPADMSRFMKKQ